MKVKRLPTNSTLEVGDWIKVENTLGHPWWKIHRVTNKFAFVKFNDVAEGKYPRVYIEKEFNQIPRERYERRIFTAWRTIEEKEETNEG